MLEKILIKDFGSPYTQLIARALREKNIFCEISPYNKAVSLQDNVKGIILSGAPISLKEFNSADFDIETYKDYPLLGIGFGAHLLAQHFGGRFTSVADPSHLKENLTFDDKHPLFQNFPIKNKIWIAQQDELLELPDGFNSIAGLDDKKNIGFTYQENGWNIAGLQFHPEVHNTSQGAVILTNFAENICRCRAEWTPEYFIESQVKEIKSLIGDGEVIMALSGGVDSTVAASIIHKAIGDKLHGIFVNHGLLRKNEFEEVMEAYKAMGLNVKGIDASALFYERLKGHPDPEEKRKIIGKTFIDIFEKEAKALNGIKFLGQGTIYPDIIESVSIGGKKVQVKSHHNVGGLPEKMGLKLVEPLKTLFKDDVRRIGAVLQVPENILNRHPFPGPGLGVRVVGEITPDKVAILQEADAIFINKLKTTGLYATIWQAAAILLPIRTVGVTNNERTYEYPLILRAIDSIDGMTAEWIRLDYDFMAEVSDEIIHQVKGVNRVAYDISNKPPATIEWE